MASKRQRDREQLPAEDLDWLDDEDGIDGSTRAQLEHLARHARNESARVAALKVLIELGETVDPTDPFGVDVMSDEELNRRLAGYFPGGTPEAHERERKQLQDEYERSLELRFKERQDVAALNEEIERRAHELAEEMYIARGVEDAQRSLSAEADTTEPVQEPDPVQDAQEEPTGPELIPERTAEPLPPGPIPKEILDRQWPSGRSIS